MKNIVKIVLGLLFLNSSLILVGKWTWVYYMLIPITFMFYGLILVLKKDIKIKKGNLFIMTLLFIYVFFTSISAMINSELSSFTSGLMLIFITMGLMVILPSLQKVTSYDIFVGVGIFHLPLVIVPLITKGINITPYTGVFRNPNSFGITITVLFLIALIIFIENMEQILFNKTTLIKKTTNLLWVGILTLFLYLIIISGSRTSFLTVSILFFVGLLLVVTSILRKKQFTLLFKGFVQLSLLLTAAFIFLKKTSFSFILNEYILNKFELFSSTNDISNGRSRIWSAAFQESSAFGHGGRYFISLFNLGSHNTFIEILGRFGWVAFVLFVLFIVTLLLFSLKHALVANERYKYAPFLSLVCFLGLSMGENMLYSLSMLVSFSLVGVTVFKSTQQNTVLKHRKTVSQLKQTAR